MNRFVQIIHVLLILGLPIELSVQAARYNLLFAILVFIPAYFLIENLWQLLVSSLVLIFQKHAASLDELATTLHSLLAANPGSEVVFLYLYSDDLNVLKDQLEAKFADGGQATITPRLLSGTFLVRYVLGRRIAAVNYASSAGH